MLERESAIKTNAKSYDVYRGLGELSLRRGDLKASESYTAQAMKLYDSDVQTNILMSKIQLSNKNPVKAMEYGARAIELDKSSVEAQINYAKVKVSYEGVKAGVEYLKNLINTYPAQIGYRVGLAEIFMQDEQYTLAKQVLSQVVAAEESNKEAYLLLGEAQTFLNALDDSLASYLSAARIDPSDSVAVFRSGEVYLKAGKLDKAKTQFELALRVNPLFPRIHYNLARVYYLSGLAEESIRELEEEKKLNPKLADPYEFEGDIFLATRKFQQATKEYQKASEIKPQGASIYVKLAKAYRGQGAFDAALAMLRLAAAKESGYGELYREYGYIYEAKGMAPEAAASFERYLRLEPNSPDKNLILDKINELK